MHPITALHAEVTTALNQFGIKLDLGSKPNEDCSPCKPYDFSKPYYPGVYLPDKKGDDYAKIPDTGKAVVSYKVRSRSTSKDDDGERHSLSLDLMTFEPETKDEKPKKDGAKQLSARQMLTELSDFLVLPQSFNFDDRARDAQGEYASEKSDTPDPATMHAAYGPKPGAAVPMKQVSLLSKRVATLKGAKIKGQGYQTPDPTMMSEMLEQLTELKRGDFLAKVGFFPPDFVMDNVVKGPKNSSIANKAAQSLRVHRQFIKFPAPVAIPAVGRSIPPAVGRSIPPAVGRSIPPAVDRSIPIPTAATQAEAPIVSKGLGRALKGRQVGGVIGAAAATAGLGYLGYRAFRGQQSPKQPAPSTMMGELLAQLHELGLKDTLVQGAKQAVKTVRNHPFVRDVSGRDVSKWQGVKTRRSDTLNRLRLKTQDISDGVGPVPPKWATSPGKADRVEDNLMHGKRLAQSRLNQAKLRTNRARNLVKVGAGGLAVGGAAGYAAGRSNKG
jgi:hypothetical protein